MIRVGVDVGGTFTDLVGFDDKTGVLVYLKVSTKPREAWASVVEAVESTEFPIEDIEVLVHASTLGTNIFFGQKNLELPRALLITNKGFRDIIEIGRQNRPELYNPFFKKPRPLIPRHRRIGVGGRIGPDGGEIEPLDTNAVKEIARRWCSETDVFIISFLHSYINPRHEMQAKKIIEEECPSAIVVTSHEVDPRPMEYERTSTTVVNGLLKPVLAKYLKILSENLRARGFNGKLLVMKSNGGVSSLDYAVENPAAFIESGPAAGAIATAYFSKIMGIEKTLAFDMGGTTAKASTIINGEPLMVNEYEVGGEIHMGRLVKGSGYPVRHPYIDIVEVSAGGGSIAWIDPGGALRVGPVSAGADPGPACYGKGGVDPTVTDANLVLGRLPEQIAGGRVRLYKKLAVKAIEEIARKQGLSIEETALAIIKIANTLMAKALRIVSIERGLNPREFTLYAFGGAGPLHAVELARELGIKETIIPPLPGVFSALGLLLTDYKHDYHQAVMKTNNEVDDKELEQVFKRLEEKAVKTLLEEGVQPDNIKIVRTLDIRYARQAYEITVPYVKPIEKTIELFHAMHQEKYGYKHLDEEVVIVVARITAYGYTPKPSIVKKTRPIPYKPEPGSTRKVFFEETEWTSTNVYDREKLRPGAVIKGPAIIESIDSTIVIPPGYSGYVDEYTTIRIREE
ncbi:hydantoinase/oxoprolinase family protein [Desulfurococcaceae archaeon MEX13E-LK6-19]|nr:hydantoinase/oxoprolinase family protein [Desulfurococcaceae archaeon MEX13E-LK6-19]